MKLILVFTHRVPFSALCRTFELIENTSGRLKTIEILSNFLRSVIVLSPKDFLNCIYLCLNKVAPSFEGKIFVYNLVFTNNYYIFI